MSELHDALSDPEVLRGLLAFEAPPPAVVRWLAHLRLLQGVPLRYLVPDPEMLPPESLRVFTVHEGWIEHLLDGAVSIGRVDPVSVAVDQVHLPGPGLLGAAREAAGALRARALGRPRAAREAPEQVTGFLLRSLVVREWPGLELRFLDKPGGDTLDTLRLERLGDTLLLGLCAGRFGALRFTRPGESLALRVLGRPGEPPPLRPGGVLRVAEHARRLGLSSSAELAQRLTDGPERVTFTLLEDAP